MTSAIIQKPYNLHHTYILLTSRLYFHDTKTSKILTVLISQHNPHFNCPQPFVSDCVYYNGEYPNALQHVMIYMYLTITTKIISCHQQVNLQLHKEIVLQISTIYQTSTLTISSQTCRSTVTRRRHSPSYLSTGSTTNLMGCCTYTNYYKNLSINNVNESSYSNLHNQLLLHTKGNQEIIEFKLKTTSSHIYSIH